MDKADGLHDLEFPEAIGLYDASSTSDSEWNMTAGDDPDDPHATIPYGPYDPTPGVETPPRADANMVKCDAEQPELIGSTTLPNRINWREVRPSLLGEDHRHSSRGRDSGRRRPPDPHTTPHDVDDRMVGMDSVA